MKVLFTMLAVAMTWAVAAQTRADKAEGKQPWAWTTEQRLAARFDEVSIRDRKAASEARVPEGWHTTPESVPNSGSRTEYVIEGTRNPELFLPFELMRAMLDAGFDPDVNTRKLNRALYRDGIVALGLNETDFWSVLAASQEQARHSTLTKAMSSDVVACRVRVAVLDDMRHRFGQVVFDRFLYVTVAPYTSVSSSTTSVYSGKTALLREEAGCKE